MSRTSANMSRTSAKLCHRTPSTIATHALISFAASGYSCMASLRCLRVTMCTDQSYFTICEVVKRDRAPRIEAARKSDSRSEGKKQIWCRGPGMYIAAPAHNSRSTWRHEAHQTDERPCATLLMVHKPSDRRASKPSQEDQ